MKKDPMLRQIGKNIRDMRRVRDLSQRVIACAIGVHQTALSRIESGTQQLTALQAKTLVDLLDIEFEHLFVKR